MVPPREAPPYATLAVEVLRVPGGVDRDAVAVEEPLEIRLNGRPVAVTMRTPGHDEELALGFCLTEGLRPVAARLPEDLAANTIEVDAPGADLSRVERSFYTSSSCGCAAKAPSRRSRSRRRAWKAPSPSGRACGRASGAAARGPGGVCRNRRPACDTPLRPDRRARLPARGRGAPQRDGKVIGWAFATGLLPWPTTSSA